MLTLYTTPVVYLYLDRLRLRFGRLRAGGGRRLSAGVWGLVPRSAWKRRKGR